MIKNFETVMTADIESNNWIDFLMIGLYDGLHYKVYNSLDKFLDYVLDISQTGKSIYFHNGGKFDFLFIAEKLLERGEVKFINKTSGLLAMIFSSGKTKINFYDSYAILPASLEKLIETYNIENKKIPIDFSKQRKYSDKKLHEHLRNDCISLYKILEKTFNEEGYLSLTIASQALNVFSKKFFDGDIWQTSDKFDNYFRFNYYKGGRVEVYKGAGKNLYYYDINSLYPFVMREKMPSGVPERTNKFHKGKIGFYKVELLQETNCIISPLSVKTKKGNYYVNGRGGDIFYLLSCEVELLKEDKIKFKILDGYFFATSHEVFNDYVNHYYAIKKNASGTKRYLAKLMLNSLYGKFGQKLEGTNIETNKEGGDYPIFDAYNNLFLVTRKRHIKYKGVYIAAYITALARVYHYRLMKQIGFENIYYCDTDSIITSKKAKTGTEIGDLKLEAKIKEGVFLLPKTYGYISDKNEAVVKYKGFVSGTFTYNELKDLLTGKKKLLSKSSSRILGFKESQKRKNGIDKISGKYLKMTKIEKKLKLNYCRREIIIDKQSIFTTKPFYFGDVKK